MIIFTFDCIFFIKAIKIDPCPICLHLKRNYGDVLKEVERHWRWSCAFNMAGQQGTKPDWSGRNQCRRASETRLVEQVFNVRRFLKHGVLTWDYMSRFVGSVLMTGYPCTF